MITWRQLRDITSQMTQEQLAQHILIFDSDGDWESGELCAMSEDDVADYEAQHGPDPRVHLGAPYLTTQD
jgi:hypothetical protein